MLKMSIVDAESVGQSEHCYLDWMKSQTVLGTQYVPQRNDDSSFHIFTQPFDNGWPEC